MMKENESYNRTCAQRICRRDFLRLAAAATAAGVLAGCGIEQQSDVTPTADFSLVAYCGIRCTEACPSGQYPSGCDGCKTKGGKLDPFCESCTIRACAAEKQLATCAHCDEYPECDDPLWVRFPVLRQYIDQIRSDLEG